MGLTFALVLVACGDDAASSSETSETEGTTSQETSTSNPTSASTSGVPSTSDTTPPETGSTDESSSSSEGSSTTMGPEPACGDGNQDPGEECDDGNLDQDDACTATCTIAYEVEWTVSYNGPASNMDDADAVIVDGEGNIIVVGSHRTLTDGFDLWLQQYAPDGTELWGFTWDGGNSLDDSASGIALHPSGDVILTGYTESAVDDNDVLVMRLPLGGDTPTWWFAYDGPGSGDEFDNADSGNAVMVDGNGDIVVVGSERVDGERANVLVQRYDADGGELWTQTYNGAVSGSDVCTDGVLDAAGNIYVACITQEVANVYTGWVRRYDTNGTVDWTEQLPWRPSGIALDGEENILLTGFVDAGTLDIIVSKYDSSFTEIWSRTINGPSAGSDFGHDVVADADGNVYMIGTIAVTNQQDDIYVHKFDVDGEDQWAHSHNNDEADLGDFAGGIAVDADGNVYAVGDETVLGQQRNAWVRKLLQH